MRRTINQQQPLTQPMIDHEHARELAAISDILDRMPEALERVAAEIAGGKQMSRGRDGMTAEQVVRVLVIKQMHGFSYEDLAFQLAANSCYRAFCRIGDFDRVPKRSTLQSNLKRLSAEAIEAIHIGVLMQAKEDGIENGRKVRVDCTNVETNIHEPTDSTLLWDTVRVLSRLMKQAHDRFDIAFSDHTRRAKRRMIAILNAGVMKKRIPLYRDLLKVARMTIENAEQVATQVGRLDVALVGELLRFIPLGRQVVRQTERRVLRGEAVPVDEKLVSIFEPHTDILVKGRRDVEYGHKVCLTTGKSCLVLDCEITEGNPSDSKLAKQTIERHIARYGEAPRQVVYDGGFASKDNVTGIKALGVEDVAFSKRCGLSITDMVKSSWVYQRLRNFRAGIEGVISFFKRCFGGSRCSWRGLRSFNAYVRASILSCNLLVLARHKLAAAA